MNIWQTHGPYIKAGIAGLLLLLASFAVKAWLDQREDRIRLDEELKATKQLIADRERRLKEINEVMQARNRELAESLKKITELRARPLPLPEIAAEMPQYIPLESPPKVETAELTAPEAPKTETLIFDAKGAQDLRDFYLDCHAKTLKLQACEDDADDWKRKELTWQDKEKILIQQRDAATRAVKGGTKWQRFTRNGKWFLIGAVGGVAVGVGISR